MPPQLSGGGESVPTSAQLSSSVGCQHYCNNYHCHWWESTLRKHLLIFIKTLWAWGEEQGRGQKEVLLPRGKSHQNRKGNWSARSQLLLHAEQQHSFYEGVEILSLFDQRLGWTSLKYLPPVPSNEKQTICIFTFHTDISATSSLNENRTLWSTSTLTLTIVLVHQQDTLTCYTLDDASVSQSARSHCFFLHTALTNPFK